MNRHRTLIGLVVVSLLIVAPGVAGAQTYRWVDARGGVHYSDTPPQASAMEEPADVAAARKALLDETLKALGAGNFDRVIARHRLFEDSREPATIAENRRLLKRYFTLLRSGLGRLTGFQAAKEFSRDFELDLVPTRVWDRSDCSVGEHPYKVTLVDGEQRRAADLFVKTCYAASTGKTWLRSVTIVIGQPVKAAVVKAFGAPAFPEDPAFAAVMTRFMKEMTESCERNPGMDSCESPPEATAKPAEPAKKPEGPAQASAPTSGAPGAPKPGGPAAPSPGAPPASGSR